jgi:hypothetical protein
MKTIITALFTVLCFSLSAQTGFPDISDGGFNKKEADAALTDSLQNFTCSNEKFTDSIYKSILGKHADDAPLQLSIIHRRYGTLPPAVTMTMRDLMCMFIDDFDIYFSVEEGADGTVSITTVFSHKTFNYIHLLVAKTAKRDFVQRKRPVKADFYSFIPQKLIKQ